MPSRTKPTNPPPPATRKRGAPPGNQNAIKHGFYSRRFRNLEMGDLEGGAANLVDEITGLRVAARRVLELSDDLSDDPMKAIQALNFFGLLCQRIANLSRAHASLAEKSDGPQSAISIALNDVIKEFNLRKP